MPNNNNDLDTPIGKKAFLRNLKLLGVDSEDTTILNNVDPSEQAASDLADVIKHSSGDDDVNSIIDDNDSYDSE